MSYTLLLHWALHKRYNEHRLTHIVVVQATANHQGTRSNGR